MSSWLLGGAARQAPAVRQQQQQQQQQPPPPPPPSRPPKKGTIPWLTHKMERRALREIYQAAGKRGFLKEDLLLPSLGISAGRFALDYLYYSHFMDAWSELATPSDRSLGRLIGHGSQADRITWAQSDQYLYIPLHWWFSRFRAQALPIVALPLHTVKITVHFKKLDEVAVASGGATLSSAPASGAIESCVIGSNQVYLDQMERTLFANARESEYLIDLVQHAGTDQVAAGSTSLKIPIRFNLPVKELIFFFRKNTSKAAKDYFNYNGDYTDFGDWFKDCTLQLNNNNRFAPRDPNYFRFVQPLEHHTVAAAEGALAGSGGAQARRVFVALQHASNVTGAFQDIGGIAEALKQSAVLRGRYVLFVDCAASAPYAPLVMAAPEFGPRSLRPPGELRSLALPDGIHVHAAAFSPHKLVGGQEAPGVLVAHASLFVEDVPYQPGGGTVWAATGGRIGYHDDPEAREAGGTPSILGIIRAGFAIEIQKAFLHYIGLADQALCAVLDEFESSGATRACGISRIHLPAGAAAAQRPPHRSPILSFWLRAGARCHVRPQLLTVLLNDLFGIQARAGVSCAALLAQWVSGGEAWAEEAYRAIEDPNAGCPSWYGWTRVTLHFTMRPAVVGYILVILDVGPHALLSVLDLEHLAGPLNDPVQAPAQEQRGAARPR
eukprot:tig00000681_g3087.t1